MIQRQAVALARAEEPLSNKLYQERFTVSKPTASRDLEDLVRKGVLERIGTTGKGTLLCTRAERARKGLEGLTPGSGAKGLIKGSKGSRRDGVPRNRGKAARKRHGQEAQQADLEAGRDPRPRRGLRKNVPTAEYQSVMEKGEQSPRRVAYERRNLSRLCAARPRPRRRRQRVRSDAERTRHAWLDART
jgi:hypothetical protein